MEPVISIDHLTHRFGQREAVRDLSLHVQPGEVVGLLGPNGAGKTTTVRLLNGLYQPSGGSMRVLGLDPVTQGHEVRRLSGVLTETPALYERLTAYQNLEFFGTLAGMKSGELRVRMDELLGYFGLILRAKERVGTFSKGMKQRLALARALLCRPQVLFLDEPTSGLDPEAAAQVRELILSIRQQEAGTVFVCTHHLEEAQRLCDRLAVMNRGHLLAFGSLEDLRREVAPGLWLQVELWQPLPAEVAAQLAAFSGVMNLQADGVKSLSFQVREEQVVPALVTFMVERGAQLLSVEPKQVSLEDIYFRLQKQSEAGEA